jgi:hypothetical protein
MPIQDAAIFAGDRLRIGPYELEVLPTVAKIKEQSTPDTRTVPKSKTRIPTPAANPAVAMDPPSLGELASMIESRIKRIEGQLAALHLDGGQSSTDVPQSEEIKLAQQAIASLSKQLECERERNGISFESLVAERDRLANELSDATRTASDLCRELEQVRSEQVENDAAVDLYSQQFSEAAEAHAQQIAEVSDSYAKHIAEADELQAQRIAEVSELHGERMAEVSAEVERLAERIAATDQHHQEASDRWQDNNDRLEQRLTDGVSQLTQLEQELERVRQNQEDSAAQSQLQGVQSDEIQESVRALKEQLSEQRSQQEQLQEKWVTEHQELHDKFQQLEELHRQAVAKDTADPTVHSPRAPMVEVAAEVREEQETNPDNAPMLAVSDLDDNARPESDVANAPLQREDATEGQQPQTPLSRLDQLRANRVLAEMQTEPRPGDAFDNIETPIAHPSQTGDQTDPAGDEPGLEMTDQATNLDGQTGSEDQPPVEPTLPEVADRDRMFDLLSAPQESQPAASSVETNQFDAEPASLDVGAGSPSGTAAPDDSARSPETSDAAIKNSEPTSDPPVSAADILAQMGQSDVVEQDVLVASDTSDSAPQESLDEPAKSDSVDEDDESIEAYMNQLLARVRGGDASEKPSEPATPTTGSAWQQTCESSVDDDPANKTDSSVLSELVARSEAPEQSEGMSAMRDLANNTTRSAIATYDLKNGGRSAFFKLVAAGVGVSAAVLSTLYLGDAPMVRIFGIVVGLSSAAVWTWQAVVLKQRKQATIEDSAPPASDDEEVASASDVDEDETSSSEDAGEVVDLVVSNNDSNQ